MGRIWEVLCLLESGVCSRDNNSSCSLVPWNTAGFRGIKCSSLFREEDQSGVSGLIYLTQPVDVSDTTTLPFFTNFPQRQLHISWTLQTWIHAMLYKWNCEDDLAASLCLKGTKTPNKRRILDPTRASAYVPFPLYAPRLQTFPFLWHASVKSNGVTVKS